MRQVKLETGAVGAGRWGKKGEGMKKNRVVDGED